LLLDGGTILSAFLNFKCIKEKKPGDERALSSLTVFLGFAFFQRLLFCVGEGGSNFKILLLSVTVEKLFDEK
jgi:hypothetical protein